MLILQGILEYEISSNCQNNKILPSQIGKDYDQYTFKQFQYCLETFYQDYRNITLNIENPSLTEDNDISIFLTTPKVNSLNLTVNSNINVNSLQLAQYVQQQVLYPLQLTYNINDQSTINRLYCVSNYINQTIYMKQLSVEVNVNNPDTYIYLISYSDCVNMKNKTIPTDDQKLVIDQIKVSGVMHIKNMVLIQGLYIPLTINEYIFNGYVEVQDNGFLGPYYLSGDLASININYLVLRGSIVSHGSQTNIICDDDKNKEIIIPESNIDQNIASNIQYIMDPDNNTVIEIQRPTITINTPFEFSDTQNNIKYCLPDVVFFTGVNIIVPEINIQEDGSYSLFNQLDQDLIDVKVTYDSVNVQHGVFSGLAASINQDVSINNINFNIIAQSISEESGDGKIFTITGDYNGQSINILQSKFNISISRSSQFTYNGLMNQFINSISLDTVTYNLSITGNNHPSILFADTLDSSTQFKQSLTMNLYTDNLSGNTSFYLFSSYNGDVQESPIISISMTSYRNISVNKYQLQGQEQYEGMINIEYLQPTIELTNDNIICEGVVCYYIDNDYLVNYKITGTLNTQSHTEQQLYLFKQSVDLTGVSIDLQIDISQSSFNQFQVFQQNQQNTSMVDMKLTLTLGNTIFNGLFGIVNNNISFTCNKYELTVTGNNSIYGIFESQQEEVEASVNIDIDEYNVNINVQSEQNYYVAGICNTVSQPFTYTVSDSQKASVYFVNINTDYVGITLQTLDVEEGLQQCPWISKLDSIEINEEQFKCPIELTPYSTTIKDFPHVLDQVNYALGTDVIISEDQINDIEQNAKYILTFQLQGELPENVSVIYTNNTLTNIEILVQSLSDDVIITSNQLSIFQFTNQSQQTEISQITIEIQNISTPQTQISLFNVYNSEILTFSQITIKNSNISAVNVSTFGVVNTQITIDDLNIEMSTFNAFESGSFGVLEIITGGIVQISNINMDADSILETKEYGGSIVAIGQAGQITCSNAEIYSWLNFKGYKAGAIIGIIMDDCNVNLNDVTFSVVDGHRTYLSCPTNINSVSTNINQDETSECPVIEVIESQNIQLQSEFNEIQIDGLRQAYYCINEGDYNDTKLTYINNTQLTNDKKDKSISMFSVQYKQSSHFQNIEVIMNAKIHSTTDSSLGMVGFIHQSSVNTIFYNCKSDLTFNISITTYKLMKTVYFSGYILQQLDESQNNYFVNCESNMQQQQVGSNVQNNNNGGTLPIFGYVNITTESIVNSYINCKSFIYQKSEYPYPTTIYAYQGSESCKYVLSSENLDDYIQLNSSDDDTTKYYASDICIEDPTLLDYTFVKEPVTFNSTELKSDDASSTYYVTEYIPLEYSGNTITVNLNLPENLDKPISIFKPDCTSINQVTLTVTSENQLTSSSLSIVSNPQNDLTIQGSNITLDINNSNVNVYFITNIVQHQVQVIDCDFNGQVNVKSTSTIGQVLSEGSLTLQGNTYNMTLEATGNGSFLVELISGGNVELTQNEILVDSSVKSGEFGAGLVSYVEEGNEQTVIINGNIVNGFVNNVNTIKGAAMIAFIAEDKSVSYQNNVYNIGTHERVYGSCPGSIVSPGKFIDAEGEGTNTCPEIEETLIETDGQVNEQIWTLLNQDINDTIIKYSVNIELTEQQQHSKYQIIDQQNSYYVQNVEISSSFSITSTSQSTAQISLFTDSINDEYIFYNCQQDITLTVTTTNVESYSDIQVAGFGNQAQGVAYFLNCGINLQYNVDKDGLKYTGYVYDPSNDDSKKIQYIVSKSFVEQQGTGTIDLMSYQPNEQVDEGEEQTANCRTTTHYLDTEYTTVIDGEGYTYCQLDENLNWFSNYSFEIPPSSDNTLEITTFNITLTDGQQSYIENPQQYNSETIYINVSVPQDGFTDKNLSVFGNVQGTISGLTIQSTQFDASSCQTFSIFAPTGNVDFQSVQITLNTDVPHPTTNIYGFVGKQNNHNITMNECQFLGNIQAKTASALGSINKQEDVETTKIQVIIQHLTVNVTLNISESGSFIIYECNNSVLSITNTSVVGESEITGYSVASIAYNLSNVDLTLGDITLNGWVNALNYTSAGIIAYGYLNDSQYGDITNVVFAPGEGHMNYYNCYTQDVMGIETPNGITCPENNQETINGTEYSYGAQSISPASIKAKAVEYIIPIQEGTDYNNSLIDLQLSNTSMLDKSDGNNSSPNLASIFEPLKTSSITMFINIKLQGQIYQMKANTDVNFYFAGFVAQQDVNQTFFKCSNVLSIESKFAKRAAPSTNGAFIQQGLFILIQSNNVFSQFINCTSNTNHSITDNNKKIIEVNGFIAQPQPGNQYINCISNVINSTGGNYVLFQPFEQSDDQSSKDCEDITDNSCEEDPNLQWW